MSVGVSAANSYNNSYNAYNSGNASLNGGNSAQGSSGMPGAPGNLTPQDQTVYSDMISLQQAQNSPAGMDQAAKKLLGDVVSQLTPKGQRLFLYTIMYGNVKTPQQVKAFNKLLQANANNKLGIITLAVADTIAQAAASQQQQQGAGGNQQGMMHESPASAVVAPASYAVSNNTNLATQNQASSTSQNQNS
jgi:hypothetical protein